MRVPWRIGEKHNYLTYLRPDVKRKDHGIFQCVCGVEKSIRKAFVRSGNTVSCGCKAKVKLTEVVTTHGLSQKSIYQIWKRVVYAGCCEAWKNDIHTFLADMGEPLPHQTDVVRIDKTLPHAPGNTVWAETSQTVCTQGLRQDNKCGVKGVSRSSTKSGTPVWRAKVQYKGKLKQKYFPFTEQGLLEAETWVRQTREQLHGIFATHE